MAVSALPGLVAKGLQGTLTLFIEQHAFNETLVKVIVAKINVSSSNLTSIRPRGKWTVSMFANVNFTALLSVLTVH